MFSVICYDLDTLSYTFDHIWTNLLTQCTPVPVSVFCWFFILGFPHILKVLQKFGKNRIKNQRIGGSRTPKEGRGATTRCPGGHLARPRAWSRQGGACTPGGPHGCPP